MTRTASPVPATAAARSATHHTKLRLKTIAGLFALSVVILSGSPALATPIAHHHVHCHSCEQKASAPSRTGGNTMPDDWPAEMILD
jgi:hypothetical protein